MHRVPEPVFITCLVRDPALQVRDGLDPGTVKRYENVLASETELPPVTVVAVGETLYLVDGWHRVLAHERRGSKQVLATVIPGTLEDARWEAALANMRHGLPLKPREVRRVFSVYMAARHYRDGRRYKSYREIASDLQGAVRHTTIRHWMKDYRNVYRAMAAAGEDVGSPSDAEWPAPDPGAYAEAAWQRNIDSAFAALRGVPSERRLALLKAMWDRIELRDVAALLAEERSRAVDFDF